MARETSGLQSNQVLKRTKVYRDVRPFYQRWYEAWVHPSQCVTFAFVSLIVMTIIPSLMDFFIFCMIVQGVLTKIRFSDGHFRLPMRLPRSCFFKVDRASRRASEQNKFKKADGIFYIGKGTDPGQDYELWLDSKDMGTHTLILGTTGAGKTVAMQALANSFLCIGGGLIYVDPKASPSLLFEFFVICRRLGRDCDLRILSFAKDKTSNSLQKSISNRPDRASNTMNPLSVCTAPDIVTMLCSLLPKDDGGSNAVFKQKGITLLRSLLPLLVKLRDKKMLDLSMSILSSYMDPDMSATLVYPKNPEQMKKCREFDESVNMYIKERYGSLDKKTKDEQKNIKKDAVLSVLEFSKEYKDILCLKYRGIFEQHEIDAMRQMLKSVNYNEEKPLYGSGEEEGQTQQFFDQYAYGRSYFTEAMATMSQEFGDIFNAPQGEADIFDVIFNNRILIVNITSMSLSVDESQTIGKIVLAQVKGGIAFGIPPKIEGTSDEILDAQVSVARAPMGVFVDEYAAISTPGFAVVCTQARSLGFCAVIGTQDIPGLKKADSAEAGMIIANTSVKYFMRQKDPNETYDLVKKLFGERYVQKFDLKDKSADTGQMERVAAVDLEDLKQQNEGEFHCSFDDMLIRGRFPYIVPSTGNSQLRLIRDVVTNLPNEELIHSIAEIQKKYSEQFGCENCIAA